MADVKPGQGKYKVIVTCAVVRILDGSERYLYHGAAFNAAQADEARIAHLVSVGLIEKLPDPEPVAPEPTDAEKAAAAQAAAEKSAKAKEAAAAKTAKAKADADAKAKADAAAAAAAKTATT